MIIFFINRFNDIDHMVPIVYRMAKDTNEEILILSLNPLYDISDDFRLNYLKDRYSIPVSYLYNYYAPSKFYNFLGNLVCSTYLGGSFIKNISVCFLSFNLNSIKQRKFQESVFHLMSGLFRSSMIRLKLLEKFIKKIFNKKWAEGLFKSLKPSVLIFDPASQLRLYNVASLLWAAKRLRIPTIDVPHGMPIYVKHPPLYNKAWRDLLKANKDYQVVNHRFWRDECVNNGFDAKKITVLGSARFCKEWEDILYQILPPDSSLGDKGAGKMKVVYMDRGADRHGEYKGIVEDSIEKIYGLKFVHLLFKPQTRSNKIFMNVPLSVDISYGNSVNLIQWSDVAIILQSSIMIEALLLDKVVIYPRFFHGDKTIFEEFGACWTVDSHEELEDALKTLEKNPTYKPYTQKNIESFLNEIVYNGEYGRDILGDYKDFILQVSKG